jgi:hypothetical protein
LLAVSAGVSRDDARMVDTWIFAVSRAVRFESDCCFTSRCCNIAISLIDHRRDSSVLGLGTKKNVVMAGRAG